MREVRAVPEPRQRRRVHVVPDDPEEPTEPRPAPAAMPLAVDQHKRPRTSLHAIRLGRVNVFGKAERRAPEPCEGAPTAHNRFADRTPPGQAALQEMSLTGIARLTAAGPGVT